MEAREGALALEEVWMGPGWEVRLVTKGEVQLRTHRLCASCQNHARPEMYLKRKYIEYLFALLLRN